jgi:hypothetical protein
MGTKTPNSLKEVMEDLRIRGQKKNYVDLLSPYANINSLKEGVSIRLTEEEMRYVKENFTL